MDIQQIKEIALANVASPDYDYFYRYVCRWFSKTFHTPLQDVYDVPVDQVFLAYFEEGYERLKESEDGEDAMIRDMMTAIDPNWSEEEEESIQEFIEMLEKEIEAKEKGKVGAGRQSLHSTKVEPPGPVVKRFEETLPEDADGDGLEGLDSIAKGVGEDQQ